MEPCFARSEPSSAWEMLFDHLSLKQQDPGNITPTNYVILVIGTAGGVGSILIQLAKKLTGASVVATASRLESRQWVESLGADFIVNHREPLQPQIEQLVSEGKIASITHVSSLNATISTLMITWQYSVPLARSP